MPTSPNDSSPRPSIAAPVIAWSIIQMIPLLLCAAHVPFWARADAQTIENIALDVMLVTQFAASAMLFPWLMRDVKSSMFVILSSVIFVELAGMLGGVTWGTTGIASAQISVWLIALALWCIVFRSERTQLIAISIATGAVIGGNMVRYLSLEFGPGSTQSAGYLVGVSLMANLICALVGALITLRKVK